MLDAILAVYLWVIIFSIMCWLVVPSSPTKICLLGEESQEKVNSKVVLLEETIDQLTVILARKVAGQLGIPQKINGKDKNKKSLISEIKLKIQGREKEVANALEQALNQSQTEVKKSKIKVKSEFKF